MHPWAPFGPYPLRDTEKFKASQQPLTVQWDVLEMQAAAASASVVWLLTAHTTDLRPYLGPAWSLSSLSHPPTLTWDIMVWSVGPGLSCHVYVIDILVRTSL